MAIFLFTEEKGFPACKIPRNLLVSTTATATTESLRIVHLCVRQILYIYLLNHKGFTFSKIPGN